MTDMLKQVSLAGKYKASAQLADAAAKEMARHCDARIAQAVQAFQKIADLIDSEADDPLDDAIKIANDAIAALALPSQLSRTGD